MCVSQRSFPWISCTKVGQCTSKETTTISSRLYSCIHFSVIHNHLQVVTSYPGQRKVDLLFRCRPLQVTMHVTVTNPQIFTDFEMKLLCAPVLFGHYYCHSSICWWDLISVLGVISCWYWGSLSYCLLSYTLVDVYSNRYIHIIINEQHRILYPLSSHDKVSFYHQTFEKMHRSWDWGEGRKWKH